MVLAAGGSRRMGATKQLLELDGKSLVVRAVEAALDAGVQTVVVVLGAKAEPIEEQLAPLPAITVRNPDWSSGLGSSVRAGLSALLAAEPALGALAILLCDQPALSPAIIRRLFEVQRATGGIAAARYGDRNGAPAVFGRAYFPALGRLTGDQGARAILNGPSAEIASIDLPELAVDLDTPADFKRWAAGAG